MDLAQRATQLLGQPPMGRRAEQGSGQRVEAILARLHDAEILLRQRREIAQVGVVCRRQADLRPYDGDKLTHGGQGLGQRRHHLGRMLGQEGEALAGLLGEAFVAPQPVGRIEGVQAHGELPWAIEEDERQLHAEDTAGHALGRQPSPLRSGMIRR